MVPRAGTVCIRPHGGVHRVRMDGAWGRLGDAHGLGECEDHGRRLVCLGYEVAGV